MITHQFHLFKAKFGLLLILGWTVAPVTEFFGTYVYNDWQFVTFLFILVIIDTLLGIVAAWNNRTFSAKGFGKFIQKVLIYSSFLVVTHVLTHFTIEGKQNTLFTWIDSVCYSSIVVRECISIFENMALINPKLMPTWLLKRFKYFDRTGKIIQSELEK